MKIIELEEKYDIIIILDDNLFYVKDKKGNLLFIATSPEEIEKGMIDSYRI